MLHAPTLGLALLVTAASANTLTSAPCSHALPAVGPDLSEDLWPNAADNSAAPAVMRLLIHAVQSSVTLASGAYTAIDPATACVWSKYGAAIEIAPVNTSPRLILYPLRRTWFGLFAPRGTPRDILATLNAHVQSILTDREFRSAFLDPNFYEPLLGSPEEFGRFAHADAAKWGAVMREVRLELN